MCQTNLIRSRTKQSTFCMLPETPAATFRLPIASGLSVHHIEHQLSVWSASALRCRRRCPFPGLLVRTSADMRRWLNRPALSDDAKQGSRHCDSKHSHTLQVSELLSGAKYAERLRHLRQREAWRMVRSGKTKPFDPKRKRL